MSKKRRIEEDLEFIKNQSFVYDSVIRNPRLVSVIKNKYLTDNLLEKYIEAEPQVFRYIKNPSMDIIKVAVSVDGGNLKYVAKELLHLIPVNIYVIALKTNLYEAIKYIPQDVLMYDISDDAKKRLIFDVDPDLAFIAGLITDEEEIKEKIRENPSLIKYVTDPSEELKCLALENNSGIATYYDVLTPKMMDIIDRKYPYMRSQLSNYTREIK